MYLLIHHIVLRASRIQLQRIGVHASIYLYDSSRRASYNDVHVAIHVLKFDARIIVNIDRMH